jgi:predicted MFS family arabinose efflux permease
MSTWSPSAAVLLSPRSLLRNVAQFLGGGQVEAGAANVLLLVHANILVYSLCFWVQQPVLPFLSQALGASPVLWGALESGMSALALVGGPVMGRLTDTRGARATLVASQCGSLAMYSLMAVATSLPILALSRVPAFVQHAMLCSQTAVAELVPAEGRTVALGRLSLSYAVGMVFGSPLGGFLASALGHRAAALIAAACTAAMLAVDVALLPTFAAKAAAEAGSSSSSSSRSGSGASGSSRSSSSAWGAAAALAQARAFLAVLAQPRVAKLLMLSLPVSIGVGAFRSMLALAGKERFGLDSSELGMFISFAAFVGLLTNVWLIAPARALLGEKHLLALCCAVLALSHAACGWIATYKELLTVTVPMTMASTALYTLCSSLMSLAVEGGNTGTAISISHASRALVGIVAPVLGGVLFQWTGFEGIALAAAAACALSGLVALLNGDEYTLNKRQQPGLDSLSKKAQ